ncbi:MULTISPECIES: alanine/glycine:cation symporter family protein [unclassified Romboutsia]|uniref:alanine/glycine:cation symporter family protein n=1 Tax=unclassified Romboutsia TaxID=2626894 RepID=UPI0018A072A1|nr:MULTISPECIES: sodium:alanine symporter family protein [unclassified Romboutsia]MDB8800688.1 sodium:alanine symporter family protein [Romboutsia sp. 1001216sp1]MDB8804032.1 sodium:alanine symporter family protein [Romboutsia sp. 1001216sp1]MDB8807210.1 sodium:alanine symporter family protein [Romboutsia sp. 1001216sp1]MDB8809677.1 sodium:alanine symporter family protein [Romboutsia sp. 1001216sp1]MDB8812087.1 sodium:alanine symporter family protein [Romboutsia sp. 1001216sp1]
MENLELFLRQLASILWGNWLLFTLLAVGLLYSFATGFVQFKNFPYIINQTIINPMKQNFKGDKSSSEGSITSFQAMCTALASCVGSGNIIGVSTALASGGIGAIFWMWVAAFLGMATKFGEIILGILYREKNNKGEYIGGPMYYISKGLNLPILGSITAILMTVQIIGGNLIQSNTISSVMKNTFSVSPLITGILLVTIVFTIVYGGLKRLATVTQKIVPIMAIFYILFGLFLILVNIDKVPGVLEDIIKSAFTFEAGVGGMAGHTIKEAMRFGVARGLYSNEAGEGSAPVIHSAANVKHPVEQAIFGVTEVFIDTIVICTITGLILGCTGVLNSGEHPSILVINAFKTIHPLMGYIVSLSLILFSLTSLMSQWYFGYVGLNYVLGETVAVNFKYVFPIFSIIGALVSMDIVWLIQDCALGLLIIPNLLALIVLVPKVKKATNEYFA